MDQPITSELICCTTTVSNRGDAARLANQLLSLRLAACVQIDGPIQSHYRWQGEVHVDEEFRLTIKTANEVWETLKAKLADIHPYDEPQIIAIPIIDVAEGYRQWLMDQVDPNNDRS